MNKPVDSLRDLITGNGTGALDTPGVPLNFIEAQMLDA